MSRPFNKIEVDLAEELIGLTEFNVGFDDRHAALVREIRDRTLEEAAQHIERNADEAQVVDASADRAWRYAAFQLRALKGGDR